MLVNQLYYLVLIFFEIFFELRNKKKSQCQIKQECIGGFMVLAAGHVEKKT